MKVSVITLQNIRNYGSVLQTLATQELLFEFFDNVEFVNYSRYNTYKFNLVKTIATNNNKGVKAFLFGIALIPTYSRWKYIFEKFLKENIKCITKEVYITEEDFTKKPIYADAYCAGSDQIWNSEWNKDILKPLFLSYTDGFKFSLSSSFGKDELEQGEREITKQLLKSFEFISVREDTGVNILNDLQLNGIQIIDPTLQMKKEYWSSLAKDRIIEGDYLLTYQLNRNSIFDNYVVEFARVHHLKLVQICIRYDHCVKKGVKIYLPEVEEFLSLFKFARYVITDSFHGLSFCINFNKQFSVIYPGEFSTRLSSVLRKFNLEHRKVCDYNDYSQYYEKIVFNGVNNTLAEERKNCQDYLDTVYGSLMRNKE